MFRHFYSANAGVGREQSHRDNSHGSGVRTGSPSFQFEPIELNEQVPSVAAVV